MTVFFQNKGLIDLDVIRTMGVSVKASSNPIGYFGTGLKYAIATLLRTGHSVVLLNGEQKYEFKTFTKSIRGKDFEMIMMGDEQLAFTTELGKNWQVWQAYRELHSNCIDELGKINKQPVDMGLDSTMIIVSGPEIDEVFDNRYSIFLHGEPDWVVDQLEIRRGASKYLYYRGVRVYELPKMSQFTYNFVMPMTLTEDRNLNSIFDAAYKLGNRIPMVPNKEFSRMIINPFGDFWDKTLDFEDCVSPSSEFLDVVEEFYSNAHCSNKAKSLLRKQRKPSTEQKSIDLSLKEIMTVNEALAMLPKLNCNLKFEEIIFVEYLGQNIEGVMKDGQIFIARPCIAKGSKWVASTLYEEFIHRDLGYPDGSRGMQQFLFDKIFQLLGELK